jgi:hypothetical protein
MAGGRNLGNKGAARGFYHETEKQEGICNAIEPINATQILAGYINETNKLQSGVGPNFLKHPKRIDKRL